MVVAIPDRMWNHTHFFDFDKIYIFGVKKFGLIILYHK